MVAGRFGGGGETEEGGIGGIAEKGFWRFSLEMFGDVDYYCYFCGQ